jgi:uncharacterized protein (DUF1501 family)
MFSRRSFLGGALAGAGLLALPRGKQVRAAAPAAKNLILVLASGGWDVTYALDPKPGLSTVDVPEGTLTTYGDLPIWTGAARPGVADFFAAHAASTAVVNGLVVRSIAHPECRKRVLTGTPSEASPDIGAICAHATGRELPLPYLVMGDSAFTGPLAASSGRVGQRNQIVALLDDEQAFPAPPVRGTPRFRPDAADEADIRAFVAASAERERATRGARAFNRRQIDDFESSLARGDLLREHAAGFGARGRNLNAAAQMALAVDVIEQGISRAAMLSSRLQWDTHDQNGDQDAFHDEMFASLTTLIDTLASRPGARAGSKLLDETLVVVVSEMSRTPKLNARAGKDHWPVTSALVIGAGVRGGRAYGGTNDRLEARPIDLARGEPVADGATLQTDSFLAGVLELAGVDPQPWFPGVQALRGFHA